MTSYTLTSIDTTGIQDYIFGSNALRENIGASELVERALHGWLERALPAPHNFAQAQLDEQVKLQTHTDLRAEVVIRGGGNALILFREQADAIATIRRLSQTLLCEAPGLEFVAEHQAFDWETEPLGGEDGVINQLAAAVNRRKQQRAPRTLIANPAVLAECRATRQPAVDFDRNRNTRAISAEIAAKLDETLQKEAEARFERIFAEVIKQDYTFERNVERFQADDGRSHLAVVHADGNGMGQRFRRVIEAYPTPEANRACLLALRDLSEQVKQAGITALKGMLKRLDQSFRHTQMAQYTIRLNRDERRERTIMPFRPLVFGGDDVTFVCDGPLGLGLAVIFLEEFERATEHLPGGRATACAGVVICKSHYPFSRAYELGEELCKQTKFALKQAQEQDPSKKQCSGLDWHIAMSGISGSIGAIREREYRSRYGNDLTMRPLSLCPSGLTPTWRNWSAFATVADGFRLRDQRAPMTQDPQILPRSKVKALRDALREESDATKEFLKTASIELPRMPGSNDLHTTGWAGKRCGYFDAIEALDFYLPIERKEAE
ncbi:MAG: Cas10/Cmr2 second palm domain-containing protein [Oscillochloridaceae bacterium umkhey_bin13]